MNFNYIKLFKRKEELENEKKKKNLRTQKRFQLLLCVRN